MARHERPVRRISSSAAASGLQRLLCALIAMSLLSASLLISFHATRPQQRLRPAAPAQYETTAQALVVQRGQTGATEEDEDKELASVMLGAAGYDNTTTSSSSFGSQSSASADAGDKATVLFPQDVLLKETPETEPNYTGIPRIIHQSWKSSSAIPKRFGPWMRSWTSAHPTWTYVFWTDADNLALFETLYPQYLHVAKGVGKIGLADMARYALLHSVGGLYVDADFECIRPFDKLLRDHELFLSSEPRAHTVLLEKSDSVSLCNAILASKPRHPLWLRVLDAICAKFEREGERDPVGLTGPRILNQTYFEYVGNQHNAANTTSVTTAVLSPEFFYPEIAYWNIASFEDACKVRQDTAAKDACAWLQRFPKGEFTNSTHATHHWQCTWCNGDGSSEYTSLQSVFDGTGSAPHRPQISSEGRVIALVPI
ncbi:hypothetical protein Gpo141_00005180 [Globisporangium polare]